MGMGKEYFVVCGPKTADNPEAVYGSERVTFVHDDSCGDVFVMSSCDIVSFGPSEHGVEVTCRRFGEKYRFYCDKIVYADDWLVDAANTYSADEARYCNIRDGVGAYGYYDRFSNIPKWKDEMNSAHRKSEYSRSEYIRKLEYFLCSNR